MAIRMYEALTSEELQQIKVELEISSEVPIIHVRYAVDVFKPELAGWNLDIFGVQAELVPPGTIGMLHRKIFYRARDGSQNLAIGRLPDDFDTSQTIDAEINLYVVSQRLSRPPSPAYAEIFWHPSLGKKLRYGGQDLPGGTDVSHLSRCFEMFENLRDFRLVSGRTRLEDNPGWRAAMLDIERYLKKPGASLDGAVTRQWDLLVADLDDDDLDDEAEGIDVDARRRKAALGKLKRWRSRWKKLPESKKRADFT